MKRLIQGFIVGALGLVSASAFGADAKISALTAMTNSTMAATDVLPIVDNSVTQTKKIAVSELDTRWRGNHSNMVQNFGFTFNTNSPSAGDGSFIITQADGSAPTTDSPIRVQYKTPTAAAATMTTQEFSSSVTLTMPSGALLGSRANAQQYLWLVGAWDGTNHELGVTAFQPNTGTLHTTIAIDTASDDGDNIYTNSAITNASIQVLGVVDITPSTAGNWGTTPTWIAPYSPALYTGKTLYTLSSIDTSVSDRAFETLSGHQINLGPGRWKLNCAVIVGQQTASGNIDYLGLKFSRNTNGSTTLASAANIDLIRGYDEEDIIFDSSGTVMSEEAMFHRREVVIDILYGNAVNCVPKVGAGTIANVTLQVQFTAERVRE